MNFYPAMWSYCFYCPDGGRTSTSIQTSAPPIYTVTRRGASRVAFALLRDARDPHDRPVIMPTARWWRSWSVHIETCV